VIGQDTPSDVRIPAGSSNTAVVGTTQYCASPPIEYIAMGVPSDLMPTSVVDEEIHITARSEIKDISRIATMHTPATSN